MKRKTDVICDIVGPRVPDLNLINDKERELNSKICMTLFKPHRIQNELTTIFSTFPEAFEHFKVTDLFIQGECPNFLLNCQEYYEGKLLAENARNLYKIDEEGKELCLDYSTVQINEYDLYHRDKSVLTISQNEIRGIVSNIIQTVVQSNIYYVKNLSTNILYRKKRNKFHPVPLLSSKQFIDLLCLILNKQSGNNIHFDNSSNALDGDSISNTYLQLKSDVSSHSDIQVDQALNETENKCTIVRLL